MKKHLLQVVLFSFLSLPGVHAQFISTYAGIGFTAGYGGDGGAATSALLFYPSDLAFDTKGNLYIADYINNLIRKVDTFGIITTVAGTVHEDTAGIGGFSGDGGPATNALLNGPIGLAIDASGNIIFADRYNNRVRKVNTVGIITTIAGNATAGYSGNGGPATNASLDNPTGIAINKTGVIYVADQNNNVIRKINAAGVIVAVAGNHTAGRSGDGGSALSASLNQPSGIAFDTSGNLFIADANNNVIRKVNSNGIINTVAGTDTAGYSGDMGSALYASLDSPKRIAFDDSNNLYISDYYNNVVRKVTTSTGIITTVAGNGYGAGTSGTSGGYAGNDSLAVNAMLFLPHGIAFDKKHTMYICDQGNDVIRRVGPPPPIDNTGVNSLSATTGFYVYPNPSKGGTLSVNVITNCKTDVQIVVMNAMGQTVKRLTSYSNKPTDVTLNVPAGIYFIHAISGNEKLVKRIIIE
jgi:trimeric autotransporter adhesin